MSPLLAMAVAMVGSYLLGSIPFGYLITRAARRIDLRLVGSGHTGGTNVLRVAGAVPAVRSAISARMRSTC